MMGRAKEPTITEYLTCMFFHYIHIRSRFLIPIPHMRKLRLMEVKKLIDIHIRI